MTFLHIANSAVMTCAKSSHDWIAEIINRANRIFTRFQLRAHKPFVKLAPDTCVYQLSAVDSGTLPTRKTPTGIKQVIEEILHKMTAGTGMTNGNIKFKRVTCPSLIGTMVHCWDHWYEWLSAILQLNQNNDPFGYLIEEILTHLYTYQWMEVHIFWPFWILKTYVLSTDHHDTRHTPSLPPPAPTIITWDTSPSPPPPPPPHANQMASIEVSN